MEVMDSKITLSFDEDVIKKAKVYAKSQGISLSRLTEMLLRRVTEQGYDNLDEIPISGWVSELAEGKAIYRKRGAGSRKDEYYESKR